MRMSFVLLHLMIGGLFLGDSVVVVEEEEEEEGEGGDGEESRIGRYVGMIMIPWKYVEDMEAQMEDLMQDAQDSSIYM